MAGLNLNGEQWLLVFPDGEPVKEGELGKWLAMIEEDDVDEDIKDFARKLVRYMRGMSN